MEEESKSLSTSHCLVVSYPAQGHLNPMLQFSKRLQHKGVNVTLVTTRFMTKSFKNKPSSTHIITVETISDGYDEGGYAQAESAKAYNASLSKVGSLTLSQLVEEHSTKNNPVNCIIYDSFLPWCLDVAHKFGLLGASFLTQTCAVGSIYYHAKQGWIDYRNLAPEILVPGLPPLQPQDLPSFLYDSESYPSAIDLLLGQFSNIHKADWVLCNTFYDLEAEVVDWLAKIWRLRTIGPTLPSMYLDKQVKGDVDYGLSIFEPSKDACIKWLDTKPKGSVVYVSFRSLASLRPEQMEEISLGLQDCGSPFLWVVRATEESKLPKNFIQETKDKGLVVAWCSQLEVLAHDAVGCFWTHCGWNSVLEALSLGMPMVGMPHWSDQATNIMYIVDVWKFGMRAPLDENGMVKRKSVASCLKEVMYEEKGKMMKVNADKWKELARASMNKGGSSDKNIDDFINALVSDKRRGMVGTII